MRTSPAIRNLPGPCADRPGSGSNVRCPRALMLIALVLSAISPNCANQVMQIGQVEWQRRDTLSRADRREILEVAKVAGLPEVVKVSKRWHRPSDEYHALVESPRIVIGGVVTWDALVVCSDVDREHCDSLRGERPWLRVGRWMTSAGSIRHEERWRVSMEPVRDIELGDGVTRPVAEMIAIAVRRRRLVNRTPRPDVLANSHSYVVDADWWQLVHERGPQVAIDTDSWRTATESVSFFTSALWMSASNWKTFLSG